jgi:hypothetical protein
VRLLRRWIRGRTAAPRCERLELRELTREIEVGLRDIDFDEVTLEDRVTFIECAVVWQVRRALRSGQFDLALALQRFGVQRIEHLHESTPSIAAERPHIVPFRSHAPARDRTG